MVVESLVRYGDDKMESGKIIEIASEACRKFGANEWEIFYIETTKFSVESKNSELDAMEESEASGVAIRVRIDERPGFSYSSNFHREALDKAVAAAVSGAKSADPDPYGAFAAPDRDIPDIDPWDDNFSSAKQSEKIDRAVAVEESARKVDRRVGNIRKASYSETLRRIRIVNHLGLDRFGRASLCSASIMAVAEEGAESQCAWDVDQSATWAGLKYREVGIRAAMDAVGLLGAKTMPTQKAAVVLRNGAACEVLEVLSESFSGEAAAKGRSMLAGKIGKKIFGDNITIFDDGLFDGGAGTFAFDGEGSPRKTNLLVDNGALERFVYDLAWARKAGTQSTGSAGRGGYTSPPKPAIANLYIKPGESSLDNILADMGRGFLVSELMGAHTANPVTGDFSVGAVGWWIENGKIAHAVQGVTIAGNIIKLLKEVDAVGSDLRFIGQVGAPSLRVPSLDIGGS